MRQSPVSASSFFLKKAKRKSTLCSWNGICTKLLSPNSWGTACTQKTPKHLQNISILLSSIWTTSTIAVSNLQDASMTSARQPTFRRIHNSCTSNTSCVTRKEQQKSERASQQLCHGCRTLLDAGSPPTAQLPQIFGLPLRDEDLVQEHCLIHCLGGKFLRMLMPESTLNLRIALLNDGVANHGHLLFGLTFNGPWVVDDDRSHTNLLSIFDSAQCSERNQRMEVRDISPRILCQLGGQHMGGTLCKLIHGYPGLVGHVFWIN